MNRSLSLGLLGLALLTGALLSGCGDSGKGAAPAQTAKVSAQAVTAAYKAEGSVVNSWQGGLQGAVRLTNVSGDPVKSFSLRFRLSGGATVQDLWNAVKAGPDADGYYTVTNPDWLPYNPVGANASYEVGFTAKGAGTITDLKLLKVNGGDVTDGGGGGGGGGTGDTTPPTVSLKAGGTTAFTAPGTLTLTATASDNVGVSRVEFWHHEKVGEASKAPYTYSKAITAADNGMHHFTAIAYDAAGNKTESAEVMVTVNIATDPGTGTGDLKPTTTIASLCPDWKARYIDRDFLDYLPGAADTGGHNHDGTGDGGDQKMDGAKAALYGVNLAAIQAHATDMGSLTLGDLGTQAIKHVANLKAQGFSMQAACQLLPRLMLLPDTTEPLTYFKSFASEWPEKLSGVVANAPARFIQAQWPNDARTYVPAEKAERDRCHDLEQFEGHAGWVDGDDTPFLNDATHPILNIIKKRLHPVTGAPLGAGFTANAPMSVDIAVHEQNASFWYQSFTFKNTGKVPYYLDCGVMWWVGPSGMGTSLRNGHYDNFQRPHRGYGHPQRDVIEVVYDPALKLSAYVVRFDFHDEPYNMRTAYPNQLWALEVGTPGDVNQYTPAQRAQIMALMRDTLHVELEQTLDKNLPIFNALKMRNRYTN